MTFFKRKVVFISKQVKLMKSYIIFLLLFIVLSCKKSNVENFESDLVSASGDNFEEILEIPNTQQPASVRDVEDKITQKLIKNGGLEFESIDIKKDYKTITGLLSASGAYIENENQNRTYGKINYELTIRVPAVYYDTLYQAMVGVVKKIDKKYSQVQDVTEQYYDLETRIKNKKVLETRYLKLLDRASEIKDILEVEKKISDVRVEVEKMEGKLRYLKKKIGFSTIQLSFYQWVPTGENEILKDSFFSKLWNAFKTGWNGLLSFIVVLISIWPFILIAFGITYGIIRLRKGIKNKRKNNL